MTGPMHEVLGATAGVAVGAAAGLPWEEVAVLASCSLAASCLPDILELGWLKHRTVTHSLLAVALFVSLCVATGSMAGGVMVVGDTGLALGYVVHLLADMCTPHGVPLAWPVSDRCAHVLPRRLRVRTGSFRESVLMFAVPLTVALVLLAVPR